MDHITQLNAEATTPTTIRRTRGALADLSRQLIAVSLLTTPNNQMPSSMDTPTSSPEEMVIKLRGQKNPVTWSPLSLNEVRKLSHYEVTPTKDATPTRVMLGLRCSPRKRLQLNETGETISMSPPEKMRKLSSSSNRKPIKLEDDPVPLDLVLNGLSRSQLISVIQNLATINEEVKQKLESLLPEPDLQPMLDELSYLKKNIFKSLPNCRLSSKTDSAAYNKTSVHLSAFKKRLLDYCKQLVESRQWKSVVEFTLNAWNLVKATPIWDNAQHNSVRKQCFKSLSTNCLKALKSADGELEWRHEIKKRLERLRGDSDDLDMCIAYLDTADG
ncbi:hypothetical protein DAPPUDRAFT_305307 [Daphnia pulex]|uniref:Uncharacterized protein n=1 Tax=Daphnia pulex TaxID=6669 RepID=E9GRT8_DAPPU|nr:uncharacterized protein LOC124312688 [Daphnia pulicaria]EFX77859.1 hypothetical protein DAPPUDRAFT_305307 [Daphnia pulex]|eukprot:EFX77859.1 hypothetical protein DAPPUDRAFT_305307 [Daphnia pulex]